jgi:hypothetical protein
LLKVEFAKSEICLQAVLPGATPTRFWAIAGTALHQPPSKTVVTADDLIDAAIAGLDQGELVTIPVPPGYCRLGGIWYCAAKHAAEALTQFPCTALSRVRDAVAHNSQIS